ncbi:hypothetical protein [Streptomyces sp. Tue6028]|uniref:hypothetical protein n=1 Tax=Streptomyces sp. Tue6028 TaxID=2036037 RepID=UPI003D70C92A
MDPVTAITADGVLRAGATVAGQAVGGALRRPKLTLIKIGSRDERRDAYVRYLTVATALARLIMDRMELTTALTKEDSDLEPSKAFKKAAERFEPAAHEMHREELAAQAEVLLTGRQPVTIALPILVAVLRTADAARTLGEYQESQKYFDIAVDAYVHACRIDLRYVDPWWKAWKHAGRWIEERFRSFLKKPKYADLHEFGDEVMDHRSEVRNRMRDRGQFPASLASASASVPPQKTAGAEVPEGSTGHD